MSDPLRVYLATRTADERAELAARLARDTRWVVVDDPARADVVLTGVDEWLRLQARTSPVSGRARERLIEGLTPREHEVLTLVADGLHNRDIAAKLGVTEHTVKFHLAAVFGKLGATTRTEAVQKALRAGVIEI